MNAGRMNPDGLAERILDGDVRAAARLMRLLDDSIPGAEDELDELFPHTGNAHVVGFTGNPGSGKSTLVDQFITRCRQENKTVGCVVVDPTSPFSGGAVLGDRIRMQRHALDEGVFIRSVATRGNLGGLSRSTPAMVQVLDAMGYDYVLVETVGVGQDEVDIAAHADTCIVVMVPGLGDDIQATKAGILEIASIFAVNKSDQPGSDRLKRELKTMLHLGAPAEPDRETPILKTVATTGDGVEELFDSVKSHRVWMEESGRREEILRRRFRHLVRLIAGQALYGRIDRALASTEWKGQIDAVAERKLSPYSAARELIDGIFDS